jgi:hypothetical protein
MKRRTRKMSKKFVEYIEEKITSGRPEEVEFNKTLLGLYDKGHVHVDMRDGEPFISITEKGEVAFLSEVALSFGDMIEA